MLLVLTCVAGLVEAISYLELGHVFTSAVAMVLAIWGLLLGVATPPLGLFRRGGVARGGARPRSRLAKKDLAHEGLGARSGVVGVDRHGHHPQLLGGLLTVDPFVVLVNVAHLRMPAAEVRLPRA